MEKEQSRNIVKEALQNHFDKEKFVYFVKNLLNNIDESKAFHAHGYVPEAYRGYVKTYERIATYTDPEDNKIDILVVYLQKDSSLEGARTAQRNFVARYLKDRNQKDAGLVAFVAPDLVDWRFSLVKMDYKFEEGADGRVKVKEEFTPARRWSFLVGKNENSHTAQSRLVSIIEDDQNNPVLKQLEDAFNIEKVTKEFFEKYRELFLIVLETLNDIVKHNGDIKTDFDQKGVNTVDFSKKLLGQIVFLYFLQKKGWFGVSMGKSWGAGDKFFLRTLFERASKKNKNYFNDYLEPLFYEALAKERDDDFYSRFDCRIPFLNGGLFDPINNYDWVRTTINFSNEIFSNTIKTKEGDIGNGILDIFDRYNFTVREDEPLEKEVAIDPEMLGKVFENLLEVKDRKSKGTYYTPREIVHYMCEQSLINYLADELIGKVSREDLETLIKDGDKAGENDSMVEGKGRETKAHHYKLPESIRLNACAIDDKLASIKVCDPAIGSGAFPVGMMNEIVKARETLSSYIKDKNRTIYSFKRDCIQNSLYGVDIDPGAVEIAKLRLWLSLIVDEDDIKQIKPLPNLDYKIMQGNSLISKFLGIDFDNGQEDQNKYCGQFEFGSENEEESLIKEFESKKIEYQNEPGTGKKAKLSEVEDLLIKLFELKVKKQKAGYFKQIKEIEGNPFLAGLSQKMKEEAIEREKQKLSKKTGFDLENIENQLREFTSKMRTRPFFPWKLYFAEVFEKGGFDVVIANPPYGANIDDNIELFEELYPETSKGFKDIYKYFFNCSLSKLTSANGVLCFITPNTFFLQPRYGDLRKYLLNYNIISLINLGEEVFDAVVPTAISLVKGNKYNPTNKIKFSDISDASKYSGNIFDLNFIEIDQNIYFKTQNNIFTENIRIKLDDEELLENVLDFKDAGINYQRVNVGLNDKGNSDLSTRLLYEGKKEKENHIEYWKGTDINEFYISPKTGRFVRPNIHLRENERVILNGKYFNCFPKLIWRQTASVPIVAIDRIGIWFGRSIQSGVIKNSFVKKLSYEYICCLLNSSYIRNIYEKSVQEGGRVFPQVKLEKLKPLPIKIISLEKQKAFIKIVDKISAVTKSADYLESNVKQDLVKEYKKQVDQMVSQLYELRPN
jgi:hypothetical protein